MKNNSNKTKVYQCVNAKKEVILEFTSLWEAKLAMQEQKAMQPDFLSEEPKPHLEIVNIGISYK